MIPKSCQKKTTDFDSNKLAMRGKGKERKKEKKKDPKVLCTHREKKKGDEFIRSGNFLVKE